MLGFENILLSITAFCNIGLAIFVYIHNKEGRVNFFFSLFTLFLVFWALALIGYNLMDEPATAIYFMKASYIAALIIGISFYSFAVLYTTGKKHLSTLHQAFIVIPAFLFTGLLLLLPDFLTKFIVEHSWGKETVLGTPEYIFFALIFSYFFVGGLSRIWIAFFKSQPKSIRRYRLLAIGSSVSIAGALGMYFNLVLASPFLQDFRYIWTGPLFTFVIAISITYSIFRLKLFDARAIAAEIFTFALWIIILTRLLLATEPVEQLSNAGLLIVSVVIGTLLIRSVGNEFEARQRVEKLAANLEETNARLRELDRQKSEFLSIATHQLRGPLAAIRGHLSLVVDGSYGDVPDRARDVISRVFKSSGLMAQTINDFLNVSRIEQGSMQYEKKDFGCDTLVAGIVEEIRPTADEKKLELILHNACAGQCVVHADYGKLRHVFYNLIDNSIKYTPEGKIEVYVSRESQSDVIRFTVKDTGIGIDPSEIGTLFEKFVRARNATGVNINGTGLGLYVAREIVEAHNGKIWAESDGKGEGSTFIVELPVAERVRHAAKTA